MSKKDLFISAFLFIVFNFLFTSLERIHDNAFIHSLGLKRDFLLVVNLMLAALSLLNFLRIRKMSVDNPAAMVRSVMVGTLFKMMFFAIAALVYAKTQTTKVGVPTLLASMIMYLTYTWAEIQWATKKK
jgi:hypothetical protein